MAPGLQIKTLCRHSQLCNVQISVFTKAWPETEVEVAVQCHALTQAWWLPSPKAAEPAWKPAGYASASRRHTICIQEVVVCLAKAGPHAGHSERTCG
jgi:hypothetical protein